jgi:hypothetical protein
MIRYKKQFPVNSEIYHIDLRQYANFQQSSVNLTKYQKGVFYLRVNLFNVLPAYITIDSDNPKNFKFVLRKVLYENSFYSLKQYFELQKKFHIFTYNLVWCLKV